MILLKHMKIHKHAENAKNMQINLIIISRTTCKAASPWNGKKKMEKEKYNNGTKTYANNRHIEVYLHWFSFLRKERMISLKKFTRFMDAIFQKDWGFCSFRWWRSFEYQQFHSKLLKIARTLKRKKGQWFMCLFAQEPPHWAAALANPWLVHWIGPLFPSILFRSIWVDKYWIFSQIYSWNYILIVKLKTMDFKKMENIIFH